MNKLFLLITLVAPIFSGATIMAYKRDYFYCADGRDYAFYYDNTRGGPDGKGGFKRATRQLEAFCEKSQSEISDGRLPETFLSFWPGKRCYDDVDRETMLCMADFKRLNVIDGRVREEIVQGRHPKDACEIHQIKSLDQFAGLAAKQKELGGYSVSIKGFDIKYFNPWPSKTKANRDSCCRSLTRFFWKSSANIQPITSSTTPRTLILNNRRYL